MFVNDNASAEIIDILADNGVRFIAMRCAGFDRVDIEHAAKRGIRIARVPTYSPASVAEHALALMLTLSRCVFLFCATPHHHMHITRPFLRKLQLAIPRCRDGNYTVSGLQGWELASRNFGIVGTGAIGAVMARLCLVRRHTCCTHTCSSTCCHVDLQLHGFRKSYGPINLQRCTNQLQMHLSTFQPPQGFQKHTGEKPKVYAYDLFPRQDLIDAGVEYVDLDTLLANSDIVSLHCPLLPSTFHLISEEK